MYKNNYEKTFTTDSRTAYLASKQFLRQYQDDFGFQLDDVIKHIDYDIFEEEFNKQ